MSEAFIKRIKKLKDQGKVTDFEHNQLLCLGHIMSSLVNIDDSLNGINHHLSKIFHKEGKEGSPRVRWIGDNEEED